jgi:hypothetical protein
MRRVRILVLRERRSRATLLVCTAGMLLFHVVLPPTAASVQTAVARFSPAEGEVLGEFSRVVSVRELADGRVLVADRREKRLAVAGSSRGTAEETIGRLGGGPGEYTGIGSLHALGGDSTLFVEWPMPRRNILHGTRIVHTLGSASDMLPAGLLFAGVDTSGHVLGVRGLRNDGRPVASSAAANVLVLLRIDRATARVDTIARLRGRGGAGRHLQQPTGNQPGVLILSNPLAAEDMALLFPDGWIAVARVQPYRVEWRSPTGQWMTGTPLPFRAVPTSTRERCAALERLTGPRPGRCDPSILREWPAHVPAFVPSASLPVLLAAPAGRLVIARTPTVATPGNHYDVVDRQGRLTATVALPPTEAIVGFGASSVYIIETDSLGLQILRRHRWP